MSNTINKASLLSLMNLTINSRAFRGYKQDLKDGNYTEVCPPGKTVEKMTLYLLGVL